MRSPIWLIFGFVAVCCTTQKTLDEQNMSVVTFEQLPKLVQDGF
jgi:hypothetical protein